MSRFANLGSRLTAPVPDEDPDTEIPAPDVPDEDEDEKEEPNMTDTTNDAAIAAARAEGRNEANARWNTVLASEHYAGREQIAAQLLSNDAMTAEAIIAALAAALAAPKATTLTEEQQREAAEEGGRKELKSALESGKNSNVDPDGGAGGDQKLSAAETILRDQAAFTGKTTKN
jgi:hypothetical protein